MICLLLVLISKTVAEEIVEMKDTNVDKYGKGSGRGGHGRDSRGYGGGRSRAGRSMRSEASTFADMATEVSYNSRSYYSRGGRYIVVVVDVWVAVAVDEAVVEEMLEV